MGKLREEAQSGEEHIVSPKRRLGPYQEGPLCLSRISAPKNEKRS
jgi:hypothetical protein